jgi:hypothetical protein
VSDSETERLRADLAAANREIERLRSLLGLSDESSDAGKGWDPSLFTVGEQLPSVDESSPNEQKLGLFRALFAGRSWPFTSCWICSVPLKMS